MEPTSFDQRSVRYERVHDIQPHHFAALVSAAEISGSCRILDCGCGYGSVSREILRATEQERLNGDTELAIDLIEESLVQLNAARSELAAWSDSSGTKLTFIRGTFPEDLVDPVRYDVVACKMVLHEVAKDRQLRFLQGIYECLKVGGRLVLWDLCLSADLAEFYRPVFRIKDSLAGFETLAQRRNFLTEEELLGLFSSSPFRGIELVEDINYRFDTLMRLHTDFKGDEVRFNDWTNFIRRLATMLSSEALSKLQYRDDGDNITFHVRKVIAVTRRDGDGP